MLFDRFVTEIKTDSLFNQLIEPHLCLSLPLLSEANGKTAMTFVCMDVLGETRVTPKCIFSLIIPDRTLTYYELLCGEGLDVPAADSRRVGDMIDLLDRILSEYNPKMIKDYNARLTDVLFPELLTLLKKRAVVSL